MVRKLDFIQNNRGGVGGGPLGPQMHFSFYNNFIYLFLAVLGLRCCQGFSLVAAGGAVL